MFSWCCFVVDPHLHASLEMMGNPVPIFSLGFKCPDCFIWNCRYFFYPSNIKGSFKDNCLRYFALRLGWVEGIRRAIIRGLVLIAGDCHRAGSFRGSPCMLSHLYDRIFYSSHMGISGTERADSAAKAELQKDVSNCLISYTDTYQYISQYVRDMWQREWDTTVNNKLYATKPLIGEQPSAYRSVRRDKVVLSRLRLGHSYLTHSYLLKVEPPPECVTCNCRLTISHILVDCIEYDFFRLILFENNFTLTDIFNNVSGLYNTLFLLCI